ncbi:hypothetical protein FOA52_008193 [Chlamydomonas sp. UWO 241]|nr:hypothetical protein FOA52_008193 [Chlamydomonas sp. UWO 241]
MQDRVAQEAPSASNAELKEDRTAEPSPCADSPSETATADRATPNHKSSAWAACVSGCRTIHSHTVSSSQWVGERAVATWSALQPHYLVSADLLNQYGEWTQPNDDIARDAYFKAHAHHGIYPVRSTRTCDLKIFGQGHVLYFTFLKYMAFAFCALSVPAIVTMLLYFTGGSWFPSSTYNLELITLGNYGLQSANDGVAQLGALFDANPLLAEYTAGINLTSFASTRTAQVEIAVGSLFRLDAVKPSTALATGGGDKATAITAILIMFVTAVLAFFGFTLWFMVYSKQMATRTDEGVVTIRRYAVRVQRVPADVTPQEIKSHFQKYGDVARVDVAFAVYGLIDMVNARRLVLGMAERATALLQRAAAARPKVLEERETRLLNFQVDLDAIGRAITRQQQVYGSNVSVEAFVVFQEDTAKAACLADQPRTWIGQQLASPPPEQRLRRTLALRVLDAPEPSDVIFENLQASQLLRLGLWVGSWCLKLCLLLCGFILVGLAPALRGALGDWSGGASVDECDAACTYDGSSGVPQLDDTTRAFYLSCHTTGGSSCGDATICYECYCRMVISAGMLSESFFCKEYSTTIVLGYVFQALAVMSIVAVNLALPFVLRFLTELERHQTRSSEATSEARALLFMYFLNSAGGVVLAHAYLPAARARLGGTWLHSFALLGIFSDVTPSWYRDVGRTVMLSQLLGILSRIAILVGWDLWRRWNIKYRHRCLTQRELNAARDGPRFTLAERYGEHLGVVYVALTFGSVMPLLFLTTAVSFIGLYWMEKYMLLRVSSNPIHYSSDLALYVCRSLPCSTLWAFAFATWAVSMIGVGRSAAVTDALYGAVSNACDALAPLFANTNGLSAEQMADRMSQANAFPSLVALIVCGCILIVWLALVPAWELWWPVLAPLVRRGRRRMRRWLRHCLPRVTAACARCMPSSRTVRVTPSEPRPANRDPAATFSERSSLDGCVDAGPFPGGGGPVDVEPHAGSPASTAGRHSRATPPTAHKFEASGGEDGDSAFDGMDACPMQDSGAGGGADGGGGSNLKGGSSSGGGGHTDSDSDAESVASAAERVKAHSNLPSYETALRSQVLVGPACYNITEQELYGEAFADLHLMDAAGVEQIEAKLAECEKKSLFGTLGMKRKALRQRAEELAAEEVTKPLMRAMLENRAPQADGDDGDDDAACEAPVSRPSGAAHTTGGGAESEPVTPPTGWVEVAGSGKRSRRRGASSSPRRSAELNYAVNTSTIPDHAAELTAHARARLARTDVHSPAGVADTDTFGTM